MTSKPTDRVIQRTLDDLPPLTTRQKADLERLAAMPDDRIDYGDVPTLTEAQLAELHRPEHVRPRKTQITTRLDADVLAWLKVGGRGYQSRMNAILRRAMLDAK